MSREGARSVKVELRICEENGEQCVTMHLMNLAAKGFQATGLFQRDRSSSDQKLINGREEKNRGILLLDSPRAVRDMAPVRKWV